MNHDDQSQKTENLVFTREFDAPLEAVWNAWIEPDLVMRWWGPDRFSCPFARIDFREGGKAVVAMLAPEEFGGQEHCNSWSYETIEPFKRFVFISRFCDREGNPLEPSGIELPPDMPVAVRHEVLFRTTKRDTTEIRLTEFDWPEGEMKRLSILGMEQCLDKMGALFQTQKR